MVRRVLLPSLAIVATVLVFGASGFLGGGAANVVRLCAALAGLGIVAAHVLRGDEVERGLVMKACAVSFLVALAGAFALALFGDIDPAVVVANAWAALIALWLLAWALLRLRLA
jgi:hypothetical protein